MKRMFIAMIAVVFALSAVPSFGAEAVKVVTPAAPGQAVKVTTPAVKAVKAKTVKPATIQPVAPKAPVAK